MTSAAAAMAEASEAQQVPPTLRDELVALATMAAGKAKEGAVTAVTAADWARAAREALDAAGKVEAATSPAAIDRALANLGQELIDAGLMQEYASAEDPTEFLRLVLVGLTELRRRLAIAEAVHEGYTELRGMMERMERDFEAAGTETASRQANRIRTGLDDATQAINRANAAFG